MRNVWARLAGLTLILLGAVLPAAATDLSFQGYARDLEHGELLYIESHFVHAPGTSDETRVVLYRCPRGEPFARKELHYGSDREQPEFNFVDARFGHLEGLRRVGAEIEVFTRARSGDATRSTRLSAGVPIVADAGFDEFVKHHWDELESGEAVRFPFLVPSRLDFLTFKVKKHGETLIEGASASVIRLNLSGFLGWFLPYIEVSYRKSDHVLMRYKGLTNIWDAKGDNDTAQIDFPSAERHEAAVDLARVRAEALVTQCR